MGRRVDIPWVGDRYTMGMGVDMLWVGVDKPWVGGPHTMGRVGQYIMGRGVDISLVGVDIPWVGWGRYAMDRGSKYHG